MITGIILAGARGGNAGRVSELNGFPMVHYALDVLRGLCAEIVIVTPDLESFSLLGERVVKDIYSESWPAGAIYTGLQAAGNRWSMVLSCGLPYTRKELVQGLRDRIPAKSPVEAIIPLGPDRRCGGAVVRQPLCGFYSKAGLPVFHEKVKSGAAALPEVLRELEVAAVPWRELDPEDERGVSFLNMETPEDLRRSRGLAPWKVRRLRSFC